MTNIKKEDIEKSNSWPFVEAKKILKERKKYIEKNVKGVCRIERNWKKMVVY